MQESPLLCTNKVMQKSSKEWLTYLHDPRVIVLAPNYDWLRKIRNKDTIVCVY